MPPVRDRPISAAWGVREIAVGEFGTSKLTIHCFSRPDQAQPQVPADQVQGPLPAFHLHPRPEGLRQGRQAQAEPAPWYVNIPIESIVCGLWRVLGTNRANRIATQMVRAQANNPPLE